MIHIPGMSDGLIGLIYDQNDGQNLPIRRQSLLGHSLLTVAEIFGRFRRCFSQYTVSIPYEKQKPEK